MARSFTLSAPQFPQVQNETGTTGPQFLLCNSKNQKALKTRTLFMNWQQNLTQIATGYVQSSFLSERLFTPFLAESLFP